MNTFITIIGKAITAVWGSKAGKILILILIGVIVIYAGSKAWLDNHDAELIAENNARWIKKIAESKKTTVIDTAYRIQENPPTHQETQASNLLTPAQSSNHNLGIASLLNDSLIILLFEPIQARFEDSSSIDTVKYFPYENGRLSRRITLDKYPKPQRIPVITVTETSMILRDPEPYKRFDWFNPKIHADLYPFTSDGILGGFSASLCSYGLSAETKDMIFYLPMIGLATDTKKILTGTLGARWNIAHYTGLFQDTHLMIVFTTKKQVLIGIGTTL